jgi:ABC-type transport system involved in Fe-S cluster assembly fused permease/ATPase subunit
MPTPPMTTTATRAAPANALATARAPASGPRARASRVPAPRVHDATAGVGVLLQTTAARRGDDRRLGGSGLRRGGSAPARLPARVRHSSARASASVPRRGVPFASPVPGVGRAVVGLGPMSIALAPRSRRRRRSRAITVSARAGAGALEALEPAANLPTSYFAEDDASASASAEVIMPPPSSKLADVFPYLFRVSVAQRGTALRLGLAVAFMVVQKSTGLAVPILFKHAVDHLTQAAILGNTDALVASSLEAAALALVASGAFKAVSGLATELRSVAFTPVAQAAGRRVALQVFNHVLNLDLSFHLDRRTGALQRIIDRGTRSITMVFRAVVFTFMPTAMELVLVCALLWNAFSWHVVAVVLTTFVAYVGWTVRMTGVSAELRKIANKMDGVTTGKAVDALLNYETVSVFGNVALEAKQYDGLLRSYHEAALGSERASSALNAGQAVILAAGMTGVLACAALGVGRGGAHALGPLTERVGDLVMANGLLLQLWAPLQFLGFFYRELRQSLVDMEAMFEVMSTRSNIKDGSKVLESTSSEEGAPPEEGDEDAKISSEEAKKRNPRRPFGARVSLKNVRFGYGPDRDVVRGVTLDVAPGQSVGVVGPSGSGKSTLLRLLLRAYDVTGGSVEIDGVDVRELKLDSLRGNIAIVPQDTVLFNDTLRHNLRYGRADAAEAEILDAAKNARLDQTLDQMPEGLDTMVGERGVKLSGGEKQRVAIARAFLRSPRLLLADEATSALDTATEVGILASLEDVAEGRTAVFVAHRLSTVKNCDVIVVMERGEIVEKGTHQELMEGKGEGRKSGMYASMWASQQAEIECETKLEEAREQSPAR